MGRVEKSGAYVRSLAAQRRLLKALIPALVAFFIVAPFLVSLLFQVDVGIFVYGVCFLAAAWLVFQRKQLERSARKADKGALAEEKVSQLLAPLRRQGWRVKPNHMLPNRRSDIDFVLMSPQGKAFAVEVKGHSGRGEIVFDGKQLKIRNGSTLRSFPENKDFLKQVTGNARALKEAEKLRWVEAVIVFPNSKVSIQTIDNRVMNVYVVDGSSLVKLLEQLAKSGSER
ncbi:MAG TPA: hypothetical protein DCP31_00795 [Cyanobacteria bacterium UBA8543]|nr:hypothetical protein [Cyanobacteria bacterium UBA8543]